MSVADDSWRRVLLGRVAEVAFFVGRKGCRNEVDVEGYDRGEESCSVSHKGSYICQHKTYFKYYRILIQNSLPNEGRRKQLWLKDKLN